MQLSSQSLVTQQLPHFTLRPIDFRYATASALHCPLDFRYATASRTSLLDFRYATTSALGQIALVLETSHSFDLVSAGTTYWVLFVGKWFIGDNQGYPK